MPDRDRYLARAVELGRRGWGRVHPNPMVGCVLVRAGRIVGEGWHAEYGGPHAEVVALKAAGERARGAEAYVSLEPCAHEGKTPPCTRALREAGVTRVLFGARDPGEASGGGAQDLAASGIEVAGPLLDVREARRENPGFFHDRTDRPWIALKLAVSLDGRISAAEGERTVLSGAPATRAVHDLRAGFDALLVGTRTALVDDPRLTARGEIVPRVPPRRIVLDAAGRLPSEARLLREPGGNVIVVTSPASGKGWRRSLEESGARIVEVTGTGDETVSLPETLRAVRAEGVHTLLCEGGGVLGTALLREGAVDRLVLIVTPVFLGEKGVSAFPDVPVSGAGLGATSGATLRKGEDASGAVPPGWEPIRQPRILGHDVWLELEPIPDGEGE